jgi:hypothetical protein
MINCNDYICALMATVETNIMHRVMLAISKAGARVFRNNVAQAWVGAVVSRSATTITLLNPRPLHAGLCNGSSDIIGWKTVEVTPDMVGKKVALFVAIETKSPRGRPSPEQLNFIQQVKEAGGLAGVAKSDDDALTIISSK